MSETCPLCGRYCGIVSACVASVAQDTSIERLERIVALKLEMMELRTVNAQLLAACEAVLDAISGDLGGMVLWINPPHQAPGVHETAHERLMTAIKSAKGSQ